MPTKRQRLAIQGDLDRCTAITVSQQGKIARLTARLERFEDTVITLASILDVEYAKRSPHYPPMLSNPELPLDDGDLDGLWYGSWEATAEARKHDPRYTDGGDQ